MPLESDIMPVGVSVFRAQSIHEPNGRAHARGRPKCLGVEARNAVVVSKPYDEVSTTLLKAIHWEMIQMMITGSSAIHCAVDTGQRDTGTAGLGDGKLFFCKLSRMGTAGHGDGRF